MAYTIGICDDNPEQLNILLGYLNCHEKAAEFAIISATDPESFLGKIAGKNQPQLVFLDIDMGKMSGIELGERIKTLYESTIIVYVTAHEKYALDAFRVRAFHYLIKPLTEDRFRRVLEEALQFIEQNRVPKVEKLFTVQLKGEIIRIKYNDIYYFEKIGHKIRICAGSRELSYYGNFVQLLEEIEDSRFIQCHQGFIVNVEKVRSYREKTLFLDGNQQLPVSRSFSESVKEMMANCLFAGKDES